MVPVNGTDIFPGCIVRANQELINGTPQEVDFAVANQLGTVTVTINFKTGHYAPAQVESMHNSYSSVEKMAIDVGCSLDFLGVKCKVDTKTSSGSDKVYDMQSFSQAYYIVLVEPEDKDKTNYFGAGVTKANCG